ncbi:MAG: hypothetical protein NWR12_11180 [Haliea sp.]|nr:hypothetical protein [Haliea sp.]
MDKGELRAIAETAAKNIKTEDDLNQFWQMLTKITVETALRFDARTRLGDLWRRDCDHTAVNAGSVVVYVSADDEAADPTPVQWMQYLTDLPAKLDIETVHVVNQKGSVLIFPLRNIKGRRSASQLFELSLLADLDGAPLNVTLNLAGTDIQSDRGSINFTAVVETPESASRSTLQGMFTGYQCHR